MSSKSDQRGSNTGQEARPPALTRRPSFYRNDSKKSSSKKGVSHAVACYKPLSSLVTSGARPSTVASRRPQPPSTNDLGTLKTIREDEADIMSVMTELTGNLPVPRYKFEAPQDAEVAHIMRIISEYLDETQVESKVMGICQNMLAKPELPYNPYPEMISRLRCLAERFHMFKRDEKSLKALLENTVTPTTCPAIFGVESCDNAWGLKDIVRVVNPTILKTYDWLLENHMPQKIHFDDNQQGFNGQVLISLLAPCIFQGTFFKDVASFSIRLHYILYGSNASMSTRIFVDQIIKQVTLLTSPDSLHVFLKAVLVSGSSGVSEWTFQLIVDKQERFRTALLEAISSKSDVSLEGIFLMDPFLKRYMRGKIELNFHFVESTSNGKERLKSYEEFPYKTLFEGVFWKKADAEAYYSLFNYSQRESVGQTSDGKPGNSSLKKKQGTDVVKKKSAGITTDIKDTFRQMQQQNIASLYEVEDAYEICHLMILSSLVDRGKTKSDFLLEMCRLHQSTSAQLLICIQLNYIIQGIINSASVLSHENHVLLNVIERLFEDYQKKLLPLLDNSFLARSCDVQTSHKFITMATNKCKQLLNEEKFLPKPFLKAMIQINSHSNVLCYQLTEDALALFPKFKELFDYCSETYHVPRPQTRIAQSSAKELSKKKSKKVLYVAEEILSHGNEIKDFTQQDNTVINVGEVVESSNRPKIMALEGALMQYLIDTKLDKVWNKFLNDILWNDHLPPNPYPRLITLFKQACLRMRFNGSTDEKVLRRILHNNAKLQNQKHFVYTVGTSNIFGHQSAVSVLDTTTFSKVRAFAQLFTRKQFIERRGQLQISLTMGITNMASLYGIMMPYLNVLCLSEFCYIRGPMGNHHESILFYSKMIIDDAQNICNNSKVIVTGLNINQASFNSQDIIDNSDYIHKKLSTAIENKEVIYLQIYKQLGWRIIPVRKQYCLFYVYVDGTKDRQDAYFPLIAKSLYCNLFLNSSEACTHFAQVSCGSDLLNPMTTSQIRPAITSLNQEIYQSLADNKLLKVYKSLLIKSLINQTTSCLPDIWRMFHCDGPTLEYLKHLNVTMQTLVNHALSVKQPAGATAINNREELGFDGLSLGKMMKAYQEKLKSVLANDCSFAPHTLWNIIKRKLQLVTERSPTSKELVLCIESQTSKILDDVNKLLEPVETWIVGDVHSTCTNVQQELKMYSKHTVLSSKS